MQPLVVADRPLAFRLAKQLFRDGWILTQDKQEFGELRFGSLRLKASGKSSEGEYEIKKKGEHIEVLKGGQVIGAYDGKENGTLTLADGTECDVQTAKEDAMPGGIVVSVIRPDGEIIMQIDTQWNLLGVPHCDLVIAPSAPTGDTRWGAIMALLRMVVEHNLWNVSREVAASTYVFCDWIRRL